MSTPHNYSFKSLPLVIDLNAPAVNLLPLPKSFTPGDCQLTLEKLMSPEWLHLKQDYCTLDYRSRPETAINERFSEDLAREMALLKSDIFEQHKALKASIEEGNEKKAALVSVSNKVNILTMDGIGKGLTKIGESLGKGIDALKTLQNPSVQTNVSNSNFFRNLAKSFSQGAQVTARVGSHAIAKTLGGAMVAGVMATMLVGAGYGVKHGFDAIAKQVPGAPTSGQVVEMVKSSAGSILSDNTVKIGSMEISKNAVKPADPMSRALEVIDKLQKSDSSLTRAQAIDMATRYAQTVVSSNTLSGADSATARADQGVLLALQAMNMSKAPTVGVAQGAPSAPAF